MLVTLKEILKIAEAKGSAIGSFNTPNMTTLQAVIAAAEEKNEPVIVTHAQLHEEMGLCKMDEIAPIMLFFADRAKVPVCVHLDHGEDLDYIKRGLDLGFTSVMYDGSDLDEKLNFVNTSIVVSLASKYGASVEAEIGSMGARELGLSKKDSTAPEKDKSIYTDPKAAEKFVNETGIDALACAFGAVHGIYLSEPQLDFERLGEIKSLVDIPLVLHGGSGISNEDYKKVIEGGIRKINYYTYLARAGGNAVKNMKDTTYFHDIEVEALKAMKADVLNAIDVFSKK